MMMTSARRSRAASSLLIVSSFFGCHSYRVEYIVNLRDASQSSATREVTKIDTEGTGERAPHWARADVTHEATPVQIPSGGYHLPGGFQHIHDCVASVDLKDADGTPRRHEAETAQDVGNLLAHARRAQPNDELTLEVACGSKTRLVERTQTIAKSGFVVAQSERDMPVWTGTTERLSTTGGNVVQLTAQDHLPQALSGFSAIGFGLPLLFCGLAALGAFDKRPGPTYPAGHSYKDAGRTCGIIVGTGFALSIGVLLWDPTLDTPLN